MYELQLLAGLPIAFDDIEIHPLTLKDIAVVGEEEYNRCLSLICFELRDIYKDDIDEELKDIMPYDIICVNCSQSDEYKKTILKSLELFLKLPFIYDKEYSVFYHEYKIINNNGLEEVKYKIIHRGNFEDIKAVIKLQNGIKEKKEEEYNPANEQARKLIEQIKNKNKEYEKINKNNVLTLFDLISIYSAYGNIGSINDTFKLTMYQFNDQFQRMSIMKEYDVNVQALLHGADSKKIKLEHYIKKIK